MFDCMERVFDPFTNAPIIEIGDLLTIKQLENINRLYGINNIMGRLVIAPNEIQCQILADKVLEQPWRL